MLILRRHHLVQESQQLKNLIGVTATVILYIIQVVPTTFLIYSANVFWLFQQPRFKLTVMQKPLIIALLVETA